ncbi:MAG: hypothetical protein N4A35_09380 [Flavobacteriales bacterium]|jgi:hypothetical protein|nr:hypothetical protein [Flavobacteriales bacterium]
MTLGRRIKYYMIGAIMGGLLSFFIFNGRGCGWLPGNRVLQTIKTSKIVTSKQDKCLLECNDINANAIYQLIENGAVNFGESDTENKNYSISNDSLRLSFQLNLKDSLAVTIINNIPNQNNCDCATIPNHEYVTLYQPNAMVLERLKNLTLSIKEKVQCELACFDLNENDVKNIFEEGEILFEQSYPNRTPNPIYYIKHSKNGIEYLYWIEQGATKSRLIHVVNYNKNNLKEGEPLSTLFEQSLKIRACDCY